VGDANGNRLAKWPEEVALGHGQCAKRCRRCDGTGITRLNKTQSVTCSVCHGAGFNGADGNIPTTAEAGSIARQIMYRIRDAQNLSIWNTLDTSLDQPFLSGI
jgi:hypothetical protein